MESRLSEGLFLDQWDWGRPARYPQTVGIPIVKIHRWGFPQWVFPAGGIPTTRFPTVMYQMLKLLKYVTTYPPHPHTRH